MGAAIALNALVVCCVHRHGAVLESSPRNSNVVDYES